MYKYTNCYLELDGTKYYDYTLYQDKYNRGESYDFLVSNDVKQRLCTLNGLVDSTITPPKGSSIYLSPNYPYQIDDIRKNYSVKRKPDSGDYNVLSGYKINKDNRFSHAFYAKVLLVYPERKEIFAFADKISEVIALHVIQDEFQGIDFSDHSKYTYFSPIIGWDVWDFTFVSDPIFKKVLDGTFEKPCIASSQLDINGENPLTVDTLRLVYEAGKKRSYEADAEKNLLLELNALNQCNWRNYPGTISTLFVEMISHGCINEIKRAPSRYSKTIQQFIRQESIANFANEEDFNMLLAFVDSLLNIGSCKFTDTNTLWLRRYGIGISDSTFNKLYKNIIKITPRQYNEERN